ncbi:hypothetical protein FWH13_03065 [Candidatus Saccharibacteria bacterium]|nr:hypothetical protein [Candidatus Saccharibacteria bacterium]
MNEAAKRIEELGIKICRHPDGTPMGFQMPDKYPTDDELKELANITSANPDYYGKENANYVSPPIPAGAWVFLVEGDDTKNESMPWAVARDMEWGEKRLEKATGYLRHLRDKGVSAALVDHRIHALLWAADRKADCWKTTLGQVGFVDYIGQPYNARRDLCPCGDVGGDEAGWNAGGPDAASGFAGASVVWLGPQSLEAELTKREYELLTAAVSEYALHHAKLVVKVMDKLAKMMEKDA